MTRGDDRLKKLYPSLTARERAVLVLRALKEGRDEDQLVRLTMPDLQVNEFNRYIDLMNRTTALRAYVGGLRALVEQMGIRWAWLVTLDVWSVRMWSVAEYVFFHTKEPVTEIEYRERLEAARAEMAPVDELAELLMERHEGWSEDDFEGEDPDDGEPLVSDAAWGRVIGEKRAELARLVKEGILQGSGTGKRLRVNAGSFYGWLGEEAPVYPDWGSEFEVLPDSERERVEGTRRLRRRAQEAVMVSPSHSGLVRQLMRKSESPPPWGDELVETLEGTLRRNFEQRWQELVAVEKVLDEVAAEFDGEDPLEPEVRETLAGIRAELEECSIRWPDGSTGFRKRKSPGRSTFQI